MWILRLGVGVGIAAVLGAMIAVGILGHRVSMRVNDISDWLQGTEALLSEVILVGAGDRLPRVAGIALQTTGGAELAASPA